MLRIEQPNTGILRVFGFILLGMLPLMLFANAVAGLGDFPLWAYSATLAFVGVVGLMCAWGGSSIDVDDVARRIRVAPMLFGHTLTALGRSTDVPQRTSLRVEDREVDDDGDAVIFHYVVIDVDAGPFDIKGYRDIDEAYDTADAMASALGIRRGSADPVNASSVRLREIRHRGRDCAPASWRDTSPDRHA